MKGDDPRLCRVVLVTFPADGDVEAFAQTLVKKRMAACVSVIPGVRSFYREGDSVRAADEVQLLIKTAEGRMRQVKHGIAHLHPYDNPEIVVLPTDGGSSKYAEWVADSTEGPIKDTPE